MTPPHWESASGSWLETLMTGRVRSGAVVLLTPTSQLSMAHPYVTVTRLVVSRLVQLAVFTVPVM